jgi:YihY family inner membrane protein
VNVEAPIRKLDRFQQQHRWAAFVFAVIKKYGDDRGSSLAALVTYYGFLSVLPLLLVFFTVVSYVLPHYPATQRRLETSAFSQFPVIGDQLKSQVGHPLHGSLIALIVGILGLLWGALGVSQILQHAFHEVWNVPGKDRPGFVSRLIRGVTLFGVLGLGVAATTAVSSLGSALNWGPLGSLLAAIPALIANVGLFYLIFRVLSPKEVANRDLLPGVVFAAVGWQILQTVGVNLVGHQLRHSSQVYGVFGVTLALLSFLYMAAQLTLYGAEINVVKARHMWPRSIVQPPMTEPDKQALRDLAIREERRPEEQVTVGFAPGNEPQNSAPGH